MKRPLFILWFLLISLSIPLLAVDEEDTDYADYIDFEELSCHQEIDPIISSFEEFYPVGEFSMRKVAPKAYREIMEMFQQSRDFERLLGADLQVGRPLTELLHQFRIRRNELAEKFKSVSFKVERDLRKVVGDFRKLLSKRGAERERAQLREQEIALKEAIRLLDAFKFAMLLYPDIKMIPDRGGLMPRALVEAEGQFFRTWTSLPPRVSAFFHTVQHAWGVFRVAMHLSRLDYLRVPVRRISELEIFGIHRNVIPGLPKLDRDLMIDLIYRNEGAIHFALVKVFRAPFTVQKIQYENVIKTAERLRDIRNKIAPYIKLSIFFTSGISAEAKARLESVGYEVHGFVL